MVILITLYSFLKCCAASRVIVLQSFDVLAHGSPKELLEDYRLASGDYEVISINAFCNLDSIYMVVGVI